MAETTKPKQSLTVPQIRYLHQAERQKLKQLIKRQRITARMMQENEGVMATLREMNGKKELDTQIPLGGGILVSGKMNVNSLMRTLPGNIVLPSSMDEITKDLEQRKEILTADLKNLDHEVRSASLAYEQITQVLEAVKQKIAKDRKGKRIRQ